MCGARKRRAPILIGSGVVVDGFLSSSTTLESLSFLKRYSNDRFCLQIRSVNISCEYLNVVESYHFFFISLPLIKSMLKHSGSLLVQGTAPGFPEQSESTSEEQNQMSVYPPSLYYLINVRVRHMGFRHDPGEGTGHALVQSTTFPETYPCRDGPGR